MGSLKLYGTDCQGHSIAENVFAFLVVVFAFRDLVFAFINLVFRFHGPFQDLDHGLLVSSMRCFYYLLLLSTGHDENFDDDGRPNDLQTLFGLAGGRDLIGAWI